MCYARKNTIVYEFHSYFEHKCPPPPNMEVLKKCCKSFHVSSSISFCNNLKKDKFKPMKQKKNLLIALFLTPYIFLVNICFRTEKKSYPQKKL